MKTNKINKFADKIGTEIIYPEQVHAGNQILECLGERIAPPLLVSQMQQGKTGVNIYVISKFITHAIANNLTYQVIYMINMRDKELKKQTKARLRKAHLNDDVEVIHLCDLDDHEIDLSVQRILIVMDECHYAIDKGSPAHRFLLKYGIIYGNPMNTWENDSVSILSVSATPFAHSIREATKAGAFQTIVLPLSLDYYSFGLMMKAGRLHQSEPIIRGKRGTKFLVDCMDTFNADCEVRGNGYFMMRVCGDGRVRAIRDFIHQKYGTDVRVEEYSTNKDAEGDIDELDEFVSIEPEKPTVVLFRGALRAGKTLKTTKYLRAWYESSVSKSDAKLQALRPLGYPSADGHSKSDDVFPIYCNMKEVKEEIAYYENLYKEEVSSVVPGGLRNNPTHSQKIVYDYEQLVFGNCPTVNEVNAECLRLGISVDPSKKGITRHTVSQNKEMNIPRALLNNTGYQQSTVGNYTAFYVDDSKFSDWEQLQNEKPHLIGKWVVPVIKDSTDKKSVKKDLAGCIKDTCIFGGNTQ